MIFVTVGTVFPFDRLIRAMDAWAESSGTPCLAQIGGGTYRPEHMSWETNLSGDAYKKAISDAEVIISHAGMGSVITALQAGVPIVMLPRQKAAEEHTTDHQMATARWLEGKPGVFIAWGENDLPSAIEAARQWRGDSPALEPVAPKDFTDRLGQQLRAWTGG